VTVRGNVVSDPRHISFDDGTTLTSFRLASNARYFDRGRQTWVDRGTTFVGVICRRAVAANVSSSVQKGQPVVVTGRLRDRLWTSNDRSGRSLEIEAETIGHDLNYGTATFIRVNRTERVRTVQEQAVDDLTYQMSQETDKERRAIDVSGLIPLDDEIADAYEDSEFDVDQEFDEDRAASRSEQTAV
jgi:single-strand DNA-binding protein